MSDPALNRLQSELSRLYLPPGPDGGTRATGDNPSLIDARGQVRAMVLALAGPADWETLSKVWHAVQAELELPAPAIAVAGADGYQLWFSLAEPVPAAQALAFLESLRLRYLADIRGSRVGMMPALPALPAASPLQAVHARPVPAPLINSSHWSAFVAPDLAPVFGDEPWLDSAPNPMGQSDLLSRLKSIPAAEFQRVLDQLQPAAAVINPPPPPGPAASADVGAAAGSGSAAGSAMGQPVPAVAERGPRRFLLDVMNDASVPLGLRIDAAKALLPFSHDPAHP